MKPLAPSPGNSGISPAVDKLIQDASMLAAFTHAGTPEKQLRLFELTARIWLSQTETADDKQAVVDRLQEIADMTGIVDKYGQDRIQAAMSDATKPQLSKDYAGEALGIKTPRARKSGARADLACGVTLDDFHAYMPSHSYIYTPTRELWPAGSVNARIPPVAEADLDRKSEPLISRPPGTAPRLPAAGAGGTRMRKRRGGWKARFMFASALSGRLK
jgi:hypothetical protein